MRWCLKIWVLFIILCAVSCTHDNQRLEAALSLAGENRAELEKVLRHYEDDTLKYRAARFLIENMPYHTYYDGKELEKFRKYFTCFTHTRKTSSELIDSLKKADGEFFMGSLQRRRDVEVIDSAYLVKNIDHAYRVWKAQPWGRNVSFQDFCEYILPYRVGDEVPEEWRERIYERYNPKLDSIRGMPQAADPLFAARVLLDTLIKERIYFTSSFPTGPHIGPKVVEWRSGSCKELADLFIYVCRSVGIACGTDVMVMRGDNNAPHFWNFVLDQEGKTYEVEYPNPPLRPAAELWNPKGKVYRETYSLNTSMMEDLDKPSDEVYPTFRYPLFKDVTPEYAGRWNRTLTLPKEVLYSEKTTSDIVYLCLSCRDSWIPVAYTHMESDSIRFHDVEGDIIFRLAFWDGQGLELCSDPILLEKTSGNLRYFNPGNKQDTVALYFKYHLYNETFIFRMPGGVFEASNDVGFRHTDTLFLVKDVPERLYNTLWVDNRKSYRYVRYRGGDGSFCNIAEVAFYDASDSGWALRGKVIGTPGCFEQNGSHEYTNVFDGDPYTSFNYKYAEGGWAGLDLGSAHRIAKIVYVPRNRDNFIRKGDVYELLYWKGRRWNSAGRQKAVADSLVYTVPENSLLYLINHTRGKDERIFEIKDGRQVFW